MKDSTIIEGTIQSEDAAKVTLTLPDNSTKVISRKEISRVVYSDIYKNQKYFYRPDLTFTAGHLVDENRDQYVVRPSLTAPAEVVLKKTEYEFIASRDISQCGGIRAGEDQKVLPLVDWIYLDLYGSGSGIGVGIENSFDSLFHYGVTLQIAEEFKEKNLIKYSVDYTPTVVAPFFTVGLNYLYSQRIGVQLYGGIGYGSVEYAWFVEQIEERENISKNAVLFKAGLKIPLRVYSYRFVYVFIDDIVFPAYDNSYMHCVSAGFGVAL